MIFIEEIRTLATKHKKGRKISMFKFFNKKNTDHETQKHVEGANIQEDSAQQESQEDGSICDIQSHEVEEIQEIQKEELSNSQEKKGFFKKMFAGLSSTRKAISDSVDSVFTSFTKIDDELFEELEEALIMADIGVNTSTEIIERLKKRVKIERTTEVSDIKRLLADVIADIMTLNEQANITPSPSVILIIGVNGVGKTTSIAKLANFYKNEGKSILLCAADTFRAAAVEQLEIWSNRSGVPIIKQQMGADPAAVVFDAVQSAKARKTDLLICDTAGRLHNKKNLMEELKKINRIVSQNYPEANQEVLLVIDATTGQNALQQVKLFKETADITGIILTKLDGTAKGGVVIAIKNEHDIPIRFIGVGEGIDDLQPFNAQDFAKAVFEG